MKTSILVLLVAYCSYALAQKQGDTWYFGYQAGLDFSTIPPTPLTNGQTYDPENDGDVEGISCISDDSGHLLFYTNGMKIWNAGQQVMPNGDYILGNFSSTQAALIVPRPGSSRYFYVFTVDDGFYDALQYGFRYSIIDICLDNGMGDVVPGQKNILVMDTVAEKLAGVRHANGVDYWIIVHKYFSDAFCSFHLTADGISDTVISHIGSRHPSLADSLPVSGDQAIGQMKVSPNGKKLAIVDANSAVPVREYFDFDNRTGIVSNWVDLQTTASLLNDDQYYGLAFSPDNSKLYSTYFGARNGISQYDLNAGNGSPAAVIASCTTITTDSTDSYFSLQSAPDGRIYSTRYVTDSGWTYLGVITDPDAAGLACHFQDSGVYLSGKSASMGLPNFITAFDYSNTACDCADTSTSDSMPNAFVMPDAFTPNGDGINDLFYPVFKYPDTAAVIVFRIYNRWGQLAYDNPKQGWDGTYRGIAQPGGIYTYFVSIDLPDPDNNGKTRMTNKTGTLALIR